MGAPPTTVTVQITLESMPSTPSWMGEVAAFAQVLTHEGILKTIQEQVRFARARFSTKICWLANRFLLSEAWLIGLAGSGW